MIFLHKARLVLLSQPKTGTTALEAGLTGRASITVTRPPEMKHMSYRGFLHHMAPFIEADGGMRREDYEVVAVMREPLDWLGSWYRYRTRDQLKTMDNHRAANFTGNMSFDTFVRDVCQPVAQQPQHAQVKTPSWVALGSSTTVGVDRLFPYEAFPDFLAYVADRTGKPIDLKSANVSPAMELELEPETLAALKQHFAFDFGLHAALSRDGAVPEAFRMRGAATASDDDRSPGV